MNNETKYTLWKNLQKSLVGIANELSQVRSVSARDESLVNRQIGRIEGLAQGIDFFIEEYSPGTTNTQARTFGFSLVDPQTQEDYQEQPEVPDEDRV